MKKISSICLLLYICTHTALSMACTHFKLTAKDNTVIIGRSMEFGPNLETDIYTVNQGTAFTSTTPDNQPGLAWKAKYGYLALDGFHLFPTSGLNTAGLSFDLLYLPGLAAYQNYHKTHASQSMPYYQIADYILGNFSSVDAIKQQLPHLNIYAKPLIHQGQSVIFPVHYIVTDKTGKSIVIEYIKGQLNIHDNPSGILTNAPSYPWQEQNLANYINLSPNAPKPIVKDGITYSATGQGGGAVGLPGDYTPPSRFVRVAYLVNTAKPTDNAKKTVNLATHILNNVDIPYGAVRGEVGDKTPDAIDYTQWVVIKDLTHQIIYVRDYADLTLRKIEMNQLKFSPNAAQFKQALVQDKTH